MPTDFGFTGQREAGEIGLYYYVARWLDPEIAHFAQADTIVPDAGNPATWNRYGYVMYNPLKYTDPSGHNPIVGILMFLFGLATPIPDLEIVGLAILWEYAITAGVDAPRLAAFAETTYYYADNVTNGGGGGQPSGDSGFNFGENWEPPNKRDIASEEDVADYYDYWAQNNPDKIIDDSTTNHFWDNLRKSGLDYQDVVEILENGKKFTDTRMFSEYKNFLLWDSNKGAYLVIDRINGDIVNIIQSAHVPSGVSQGWFDPTQLYMIPGFPVFGNSEDIHWGQ